jgi:hypothetical protein
MKTSIGGHRSRPFQMMLLGLLAGTITTGVAATAHGTNFGAYYTNGRSMTFHYSNLTTGFRDASNWARKNVMNPTDLNTSTTSTFSMSNDANVYDRDYGDTGWVGIVDCRSAASSTVCNSFRIRFNTSYRFTTAQRRYVACHEFGHAVGLKHRSSTSSCMGTPLPGSPTSAQLAWSSHDRNHVNGRY